MKPSEELKEKIYILQDKLNKLLSIKTVDTEEALDISSELDELITVYYNNTRDKY